MRSLVIPVFLAAFAVGLHGCRSQALEPGFEDQLVDSGSCRGFHYATNEEQTVLLVIKDFNESVPVSLNGEISGSMVLYINQGENLASSFCSETEGGRVSARYQATGGQYSWQADENVLKLENVRFEREVNPHSITLSKFSISID